MADKFGGIPVEEAPRDKFGGVAVVDRPSDPNHGKYGHEGYQSKLPWPLNKLEEMVSDSTDKMAKGAEKTFSHGSSTDDRLGGVSDMLHGFFNSAGLPFVLQSAATAPLKTAVGLGVGIPAQAVGEKVAEATGAGPGTSALIGDATGAVAGGTAAHGAPAIVKSPAVRGAVSGGIAALPEAALTSALKYTGIPQIVRGAAKGARAATEAAKKAPEAPPVELTPGQALAKQSGADWAKLSKDEQAMLEHVAKAQTAQAAPPPAPTGGPAGPAPPQEQPIQQPAAQPEQASAKPQTIAEMIQAEFGGRSAAQEPQPMIGGHKAAGVQPNGGGNPLRPPLAKSANPESAAPPQQNQAVTAENSPAAENSPPAIDPKASEFHANGERKSPEFRGQEKIAQNTVAKAKRFAEAMAEKGVTAAMAEKMQAGRVSEAQIGKGAPPRWGNLADFLGETEPNSSVPEIIAELRRMEAAKPEAPAPVVDAKSSPGPKSPRDMTRAELAKQAGLPANATTEQIMKALADEMEKGKPKAAAAAKGKK